MPTIAKAARIAGEPRAVEIEDDVAPEEVTRGLRRGEVHRVAGMPSVSAPSLRSGTAWWF